MNRRLFVFYLLNNDILSRVLTKWLKIVVSKKLELEISRGISFKAWNDLAKENSIILELPVDWET